MQKKELDESYEKAIQLLLDCSTKYGFIAAKNKTNNGNYDRIWARDSMICSIAAVMTNNKQLILTAKRSLQTLLKYQHEQGEIVSNVDPNTDAVSFGGTAGRVDSNLWFLIGFSQYVKKTKDYNFAKKYFQKFRKTIHLVRIHEFNNKGLIYVPMTGDWADEYIQEGYVLYDQLLYYQAFKEYDYLRKIMKAELKHDPKEKYEKIGQSIQENFWLQKRNQAKSYNKVVFGRSLKNKKSYFKPYFNPGGYGEYFDLFANSLAILTKLTNIAQEKQITSFVNKEFDKYIPAFHPVITKSNPNWKILQANYGAKFRNKPYEYHNGGIWPMVMGFYAASQKDKGKKYLQGISELNKKKEWNFNENFHGKTYAPKGTEFQAWSAAGEVIAYEACMKNKKVFK